MPTERILTRDADARPRPAEHLRAGADIDLGYRLDVLAAGVAEVVEAVGGWIYDRAMAGWRVTVHLAEAGDVRPLRILGAHAGDLATYPVSARPVAGLAVSAVLADTDDRIRHQVGAAVASGSTEVALWDRRPHGLAGRREVVEYRLTSAARTFKSHALLAAGCGGPVPPVETLLRGGHRRLGSV